ncbi:ATP-binding protein [Gilvimarinus polysaccharolyticus]|uniref:ATP-binding protein n=1 Tax=Gilvimarinus polysaccharolyticus TaxID=863921 RepID=UPI0006737BB2|nr:ATP-binding protein [Gilvimarinus polysaccharolyticus]
MKDKKEYRISIDPRILELLGPSLYTNIYFILAELIANAYDANAKNVYIIQEKGSLTVEDDGSGMSYADGDINQYLNVANETRTEKDQDYVEGSSRKRRKMGRKGVGKLAALSVSSNVEIKTIKNGEKSGFVLSRNVNDDNLLDPIPDESIKFKRIQENGTSVVMKTPQYTLHKTLSAVKNNLLKIFPHVNKEFRIHVLIGSKSVVIDSFEEELIRGLGGLITLGDQYKSLSKNFNSKLNDNDNFNKDLLKNLESKKISLKLECKDGEEDVFDLEVCGWIGVYRSTKGRKKNTNDFPDNFISLLSNNKLGEYNILPIVGKNAMSELYVVGQLHVDLFEETSLPDMALSNRQGYKTEDRRYQEVIKYVRDDLLPKAVSMRVKYASLLKNEKDKQKNEKNSKREAELRKQIDSFKSNASSSAANEIVKMFSGEGVDSERLKSLIEREINKNLPSMGIKKSIDESKKKLLLSHSNKDKVVCDFIYNLLIFNGIKAEEIIYTSSDNHLSVIPNKTPIFDYLREFFVESYSTEKIYVVYITSDSMALSWPALSEVGAGWITKSEHEVFNINSFMPKKPLDIDVVWSNLIIDENGDIELNTHELNRLIEKVEGITKSLGYNSKSKNDLIQEIQRVVAVV